MAVLRAPNRHSLPSSSGLGRGPLKAQTRVRFPLGAPPYLATKTTVVVPSKASGEAFVAKLVLAWIDCEFGGLDVELHDLTEVAVIVTDSRLVELGSAEWKVRCRPERVSDEAAAIFGYDREVWDKAPPLRQVLTELVATLPKGTKVVPAGQNVRMDVIFLERAFGKCEIPYPFDYHVIDLATLFYSWSLISGEEPAALSLRQAAQTAGLLDDVVQHRAMADTRLTLETFRHYIGALAPKSPA